MISELLELLDHGVPVCFRGSSVTFHSLPCVTDEWGTEEWSACHFHSSANEQALRIEVLHLWDPSQYIREVLHNGHS